MDLKKIEVYVHDDTGTYVYVSITGKNEEYVCECCVLMPAKPTKRVKGSVGEGETDKKTSVRVTVFLQWNSKAFTVRYRILR